MKDSVELSNNANVEFSYCALTSWMLHSSPGCWLQLTSKTISQFQQAQQIQEGPERLPTYCVFLFMALEYGVVYSCIITTAICWSSYIYSSILIQIYSQYICWQPQQTPIIIFLGRLCTESTNNETYNSLPISALLVQNSPLAVKSQRL